MPSHIGTGSKENCLKAGSQEKKWPDFQNSEQPQFPTEEPFLYIFLNNWLFMCSDIALARLF